MPCAFVAPVSVLTVGVSSAFETTLAPLREVRELPLMTVPLAM
jgi:hypothetical protein